MRSCSSHRTPQSSSVQIPLGPLSAICPRPRAAGRRAIYNLWSSGHPPPRPFLRAHSFAPRTQRFYLNLKGKQPPALPRAAQAGRRAPQICPQPGPAPARGAAPPLPPPGPAELGKLVLVSPARLSVLLPGASARGLRPQPAPSRSRSRESRPAAAGPRGKLSPRAGRRGRGAAAYRVRRAGRQTAARPTAASWCRGRRGCSHRPGVLPAPAGRSEEGVGGGSPRRRVPIHGGGRAPQVALRPLLPPVLPEPKPPRQGTGKGCPGPGRPASRAAAPATATAPGPAPSAGPAPSRPGPPPPGPRIPPARASRARPSPLQAAPTFLALERAPPPCAHFYCSSVPNLKKIILAVALASRSLQLCARAEHPS